MEVRCAECALAPRSTSVRLYLRGNFSPAHDRERPKPRHGLVRVTRFRMAAGESGVRAVAWAGKFRSWAAAALARSHPQLVIRKRNRDGSSQRKNLSRDS